MIKRNIRIKEKLLVICLFLFFISGNTSSLLAQCFPCEPGNVHNNNDDPWSGDCYLNALCLPQGNPCQANDVTLTGIFIADAMGNPVDACSLGEDVTVLLWGNFANNTGTDRYAVRTNTQVWINDDCLIELNNCSFDLLTAGTTAQALVGTFTYICGQTVELRRTWIGWETQSAVCSDAGDPSYISVCGEYAPAKCSRNFEVLEFLAPNFSYDCGDSTETTTEICFDDFTMGGIPPLSYFWEFGDGGTSTLQAPCHTYNATTGIFTVELTVTDSSGTVAGAMLDLNLDSLQCCTMAAICPPMDGGIFACLEDVPAPDTNLIVIIDSCTNVITIVQHDTLGSGCGLDTLTLLRRYLFSDGNNLDTCIQLFKIVDDVPPTITCPTDVTVECADQVPAPDPGSIIATDNCSGTASVTHVGDAISNQTCANNFTLTRTYRATDDCGNSATCTQIISVLDNILPTLTCPATITVQCANQVPVPAPGSITATDNCSGAATVTHSGDVITNQTCANNFTLTRTYLASDGCGNSASCIQTIIVFDDTAPLIICPGNLSVQCASQVPANNPGSVVTTDNCGGTATVTFVSDVLSNQTCANRFTVTRTYSAVDACGNSASCSQTITVFDNTAPIITCPGNLTFSCATEVPAANPGSVTSSENCGGSATVSHVGDIITNQTCTNRFTITRTYQAIDACGNTASCTQLITINDITPPTISCPSNTTIDFGESTLPDNTGNPTGTDNCGGTPGFTSADVITPGDCAEEFTIARTWTATDACGTTATCVQVVTVDGDCLVDLRLSKVLDGGQEEIEGGDNINFTITVSNEGEVDISSLTITDYIPLGFILNDSDWIPGTEGSTGQSASIELSIANGALDADGLNAGESVSVQITLQVADDIVPGAYSNAAEISLVFNINGTDVSEDDIDSVPDEDDTNDPDGEDDIDIALICILTVPVVTGDNYVCPNEIVTYTIQDFNPDFTYNWTLSGGGTIIDDTGETITIEWGPDPGGAFIVEVTVNLFQGCQATGIFLVYIQGSETLACQDHVQVSLNEDCIAVIVPSMILAGQGFGENYIVIIIDQNGDTIPNATLTYEHVGQTFTVKIMSECTGNSCWGTISVEDKIPPQIECICPVEGVEIFGFAGTLNANSPTFTRPNTMLQGGVCTEGIAGVPYVAFPFYLDMAGGNQFDEVTFTAPSGDSFLALYQDNFNPSDPCENLVAADDDAGANLLSQIVATLDADRTYIMVVTTFDNNGNDYGDFEISITSNANIFLVDSACQVTCLEVDQLVNGIIPDGLQPVVTDNCSEATIEILNTDANFDNCEGGYIHVTWQATDLGGNTAICVQSFDIIPLTLDDLTFPPNYLGVCGTSADPNNTGWPQINGVDITDAGGVCNIFAGYWDKELTECGGGRKIVRTWTVLNWCTSELIDSIQIIKLTDDEGPILDCPSNITVGTDFWFCYANVSVPKPIAHDECSDIETFSLASSGGTIVAFGNNFVINGLLIGTYTVTWTVTDECGNSSTCSFTITVEDDVAPVVNCDQHTIVALTNDGPYGVTLVPASVFDDGSYDNCGPVTFRARRMDSCIDFDWTTEGACIDDTPGGIPPVNSRDRGTVHRPCVPFACCDVGAGPIMVELEVTDASGNVNYCMVEATIQDKISPFVECPPDITISCDFWFNVEDEIFADAEGNNNGTLDEDPLSSIFGNMFDAFRYPESVRKNIIINDPGNHQVNQPHNWGIDGWADDNCEVNLQVRVRVIDDCSGGELPPGAPNGAVKLIERRFSASDGNEGIAPGTCTQRIWVVDFDPFYITDNTCNNSNPNDGVIWPCDVLLSTCPDSISDTGEPTVFDDACSLIGVAFEDTRFDFVDGACFKILREWSVIDWCQYNPLTGEGIWHYVQVIKVHDEEGPAFVNCPGEPVTLCVADDGVTLPDNNQAFLGEGNPLSSSCSVHLNLCQTVHEACSDFINYDVKLYLHNSTEFIYLQPLKTVPVDENHDAALCFDTRQNPSQSIRINGIPYNSPLCGDYHRILWSAEDGCGNWSHCEYLLRLEDCKQPSPVCINGLSTVVMPIGGQVTIWAKDFDASSFDDCTPADELLYSFSGDNYQPSFTYTCENVPSFGVELSVNIWVADNGTDDNCNGQISWSERNKDFCTTTIVINDNNDVCDSSESILAGEILTEYGEAVSQVKVTLINPEYTFPAFITTADGKFQFTHVIQDKGYTIIPERNDNHKNGVSTLDLVRIQKHLLGKEAFSSPYQYIAADANKSNSVSAIDLVELRKLILGVYTILPFTESWTFVDKKFTMDNPTHPWPYGRNISVDQAQGYIYDNNFVGVKVGDVNNTVQANANQILPRDGRRIMNVKATVPSSVEAGDLIEMKLTFPYRVSGFQWTMETEGLQFVGVSSDQIKIGDEHIGLLGDGVMTMSWNDMNMNATDVNRELSFVLSWKATTNGKVSKMIRLTSLVASAESYTVEDEILDVKLTYTNSESQPDFGLYQNKPNPWNGQTTIGFDLPKDDHAKLTIFDVNGKTITTIEGDYTAGYNTIVLTAKDVPSSGIMYYRLESGEYSASKKMVLIR